MAIGAGRVQSCQIQVNRGQSCFEFLPLRPLDAVLKAELIAGVEMFHIEKEDAEAAGAALPTKRWHSVKWRILAKCGESGHTPPPNGILLWHPCLGRPAGLPAVRLPGRRTHRGRVWLLGRGRKDRFPMIVITRSKSGWWLLMLFVPSIEMMLVAALAARGESHLLDVPGVLMLSRGQVEQLSLNAINLPVAVVLSLVLGIWACGERPFRFGNVLAGLAFGLVVAIGNVFVAFLGFVIGPTLLRF